MCLIARAKPAAQVSLFQPSPSYHPPVMPPPACPCGPRGVGWARVILPCLGTCIQATQRTAIYRPMIGVVWVSDM